VKRSTGSVELVSGVGVDELVEARAVVVEIREAPVVADCSVATVLESTVTLSFTIAEKTVVTGGVVRTAKGVVDLTLGIAVVVVVGALVVLGARVVVTGRDDVVGVVLVGNVSRDIRLVVVMYR
jgi:hypothetical protein